MRANRDKLREMFGGKCAYCGCILPEKGWHVDHVEAVNRESKFSKDKKGRTIMVATGELRSPENDRMDNLVPSCAPCNIDKSTITLEEWRKRLGGLNECLYRNSTTFRHALRFGRLQLTQEPVVFLFEKYQSAQLQVTPEAVGLIRTPVHRPPGGAYGRGPGVEYKFEIAEDPKSEKVDELGDYVHRNEIVKP